MKKGGGSEPIIIIGPSKSVLVYALHCLEYVLGLARFQLFVPKLYYIILYISSAIFVQTDEHWTFSYFTPIMIIVGTLFSILGNRYNYLLDAFRS